MHSATESARLYTCIPIMHSDGRSGRQRLLAVNSPHSSYSVVNRGLVRPVSPVPTPEVQSLYTLYLKNVPSLTGYNYNTHSPFYICNQYIITYLLIYLLEISFHLSLIHLFLNDLWIWYRSKTIMDSFFGEGHGPSGCVYDSATVQILCPRRLRVAAVGHYLYTLSVRCPVVRPDVCPVPGEPPWP